MKKLCYLVTIPATIKAFFIPQLKYLAEHGYEVHVICSYDNELQEMLGSKVKYIPLDMPRGISFVGTIKAIRQLKRIFKKEKYDLIQYSTPNAAFYASVAAKRAKCKIRNYHLMGLRYLGASGFDKIILKTLEKISCMNSTTIECVSKSNMELGIREHLFPAKKATVVWNGSTGGVDLSRFNMNRREEWRKEIRKKQNYSEDDFVYGFVGRITKDKGIDEILEAFLSMDIGAKLLLIGGFENKEGLNQDLLKKAQNHPDIQFHDAVPDVERYFAALDVLLLPSYREGFGNVIIEAGAMGTPAIVSDIPGPIDTIDKEVTALTVPVKDVMELGKAMLKIRHLDYKRMGDNAAKFVAERFDGNKLCGKILEQKQRLLER